MQKKVKTSFGRGNINRGFTLVEIIVSLGIFVTAVTISVGALLGLFNANNKSQSMASVINDLNYSIESMVRDIRFATTYHCGGNGTLTVQQSCNNGYYDINSNGVADPTNNEVLLAVSTSSNPTVYRFRNGYIEKLVGAFYVPITSDDVTIQYARFYTFNTTPGDSNQPYVILVIRGFAGKKPAAQTTFTIQTVVSQRGLDL